MSALSTTPWSDHWCQKHHRWLLALVAMATLLPGTGTIPLMDRDEPRFAHATVEMMERDSWVVPYFNDEYRFDKPPLTYWWMALHYKLFGVNELAARLHSVVAALLIALVIAAFGNRLAGGRAGLLAGFSWLTSLQVLVHGRLCVADMPMVLFVTLATRALYELLATGEASPGTYQRWRWVLFVALGLGFLAKGPIAWFVPLLTLLLWRWVLHRKPVAWKNLRPLEGSVIMLLIVAAWGVPALLATHGDFWRTGIGEHIVKRGTDVFNGRVFIPGFYLVTIFASLFPWIGFIVPLWKNARAKWDASHAFLVAWLLAPQITFFFYATQLPHYTMPGFPAFSLLIGLFLTGRERPQEPPFVLTVLCLMIAALGLCVWHFAGSTGADAQLLPVLQNAGIFLAAIALAAWVAIQVGLRGHGPSTAVIGSVALIILASRIEKTADALRQTNPAILAAANLNDPDAIPGAAHSDGKRVGLIFNEPSLVFYAGYPWTFAGRHASAAKMVEKNPAATVVLLNREWTMSDWIKTPGASHHPRPPSRDLHDENAQFLAQHPQLQSQTLSGLDLARSSWVELILLTPKRAASTSP